jgi:alpha-mannosidase
VLAMTCVRSPVYAWHDPRQLEPDGVYEYLDQGIQRFRYRLQPHAGDWRIAGVVRNAAVLNQPVTPLIECFHSGPLPLRQSYLTVDGPGADQVVFSVLKRDEDDNGAVVLRGYETAGRPAEVSIELPFLGRRAETVFKPSEVKTLLIPSSSEAAITEVDLLEWDPAKPPPGILAPKRG